MCVVRNPSQREIFFEERNAQFQPLRLGKSTRAETKNVELTPFCKPLFRPKADPHLFFVNRLDNACWRARGVYRVCWLFSSQRVEREVDVFT